MNKKIIMSVLLLTGLIATNVAAKSFVSEVSINGLETKTKLNNNGKKVTTEARTKEHVVCSKFSDKNIPKYSYTITQSLKKRTSSSGNMYRMSGIYKEYSCNNGMIEKKFSQQFLIPANYFPHDDYYLVKGTKINILIKK